MTSSAQARQFYQIPEMVFDRDGPFDEWKQDCSFVSVELDDGSVYDGLLVLYPNYFARVRDFDRLPFDPASVVRVFQTEADKKPQKCGDWTEIPNPWAKNK